MTGFSRMLFPVLAIAGLACLSLPVFAQDTDDEDYKPVLPDVGIYKAMLDANKQTGWIQFRNYDDKQLIYFTALQTMHCRLSEIRYSINSDALDKRFPLGTCNPQIPFNLPDSDTNEYIYISLPAGEAKTLAIQAVWDDGAGSEIVVYNPAKALGTQPARRSRRSSGRRNRCRNRWRLIRRSAPCNRKHRERRSWRRQPHRQPALRFARRPLVAAHSASR